MEAFAGARENFISVLEDVAHDIETMDLDSAKQHLINKIDKSKINEASKSKMKRIIQTKQNLFSLIKYVWDAILVYKEPALKVISEELEEEVKLSHDLRFKVAEKLDQVAAMLEAAKGSCDPPCEECLSMPEFVEDMPIFLIVQEMPTFMPAVPFESPEMPDFNIQEMPIWVEE